MQMAKFQSSLGADIPQNGQHRIRSMDDGHEVLHRAIGQKHSEAVEVEPLLGFADDDEQSFSQIWRKIVPNSFCVGNVCNRQQMLTYILANVTEDEHFN